MTDRTLHATFAILVAVVLRRFSGAPNPRFTSVPFDDTMAGTVGGGLLGHGRSRSARNSGADLLPVAEAEDRKRVRRK